MASYLRGLISATSKREARAILRRLTKHRLAAGGLITAGESSYWWRGRIETATYFNLSVFTTARHKRAIIRDVESTHHDEVPIVAFFEIEHANDSFLRWIDASTR